MSFYYGTYSGLDRWDPTLISGSACKLWLDGDDPDVVITNGNNIELWVDKSNNFQGVGGELYNNTTMANGDDVYDSITTISNGHRLINMSGTARAFINPISVDVGEVFKIEFNLKINSYTSFLTLTFKRNNTNGDVARSTTKSINLDNHPIGTTIHYTIWLVGNIILDTSSYLEFLVTNAIDFEITNLSVKSSNDNHFTQVTTSAQPYYSSSINAVVFDGVQEYLDGTGSIDNFKDDTQGEWIVTWRSVTDDYNWSIVLSDDTTATNRFGFYYDEPNNEYRAQHRDVGGTNVFKGIQTGLNTVITSFSSNGSTYKFVENMLEGSYFSGLDNGEWHVDNLTLNQMALASVINTSVTYEVCEIYELIYFNRQLKPKERAMVFRYLNNKHGVY